MFLGRTMDLEFIMRTECLPHLPIPIRSNFESYYVRNGAQAPVPERVNGEFSSGVDWFVFEKQQ